MSTDEKYIQVMELFGPTIQGEGIMTGTVTHFLRTGGCSLRCSWCDSLFAVLPAEIKKHRRLMTTNDLLFEITSMPWAPYITFTGGDPCIQPRLGDLIPVINSIGIRVAVETQGMFFPNWLENCDVITFSPKGPSSDNVVNIEDMHTYMRALGTKRSQRVCVKIVVFNEEDFQYAMDVYLSIPPGYYDAFYFTAGTPMFDDLPSRIDGILSNQHALAELMLDKSKLGHFNEKVHLGCQQHVMLWPDKDKGV